MTWSEIVSAALTEIGALGAGETVSPENSTWALVKANSILDQWNAQRIAVYADVFTTETLTASLSPHTIGPTGTWTFTQRPVSIEGISLEIGTDVFTPVHPRDVQWYNALSTPEIEGVPTEYYYDANWSNGKLYFYPVPSQAWDVRLWTRQYLAAVTGSTTFTLPPGYQEALTLTLALALCPSFNKAPSPLLLLREREAKAIIFANNSEAPRLMTQDAGMPSQSGRMTTFNYISRSFGG